ncbi:MAG: serine/threonine protein kinase [Planctomycetes bacterium]|nr:serine/threonine protein kinase [Planctomycetota bacterium]
MGPRPYRVGDLIGEGLRVLAVRRGELSTVYVCRQDLPGGRRAYKALKAFHLENEDLRRGLFERELAHWIGLHPHPHIVRALDADRARDLLILELVHGPNLREVASHSPVHPRHFIRWAREVASAIRFLHVENRFIHRDLRPGNVLVDTEQDLAAKISDLGIGKPFDPAVTQHTVIGAFTYMAPEVHDALTDFRSDIFSFGATLYYLLTGEYAVRLTTRDLQPVTSPSRLLPAVPEEASAVVLKCMEKDPERRYPSVDEVIRDLEALREWPVEPLPYGQCSAHAYAYFAPSPRRRCPFCLYEEAFEAQEETLDSLLRRGSR